jgi:predicted transcriptional regulator YheO
VFSVLRIRSRTADELFENSLRQTLYDGAEIILDILKEEMLQYVAIKNQNLTINDILEEIKCKERRKTKDKKISEPTWF